MYLFFNYKLVLWSVFSCSAAVVPGLKLEYQDKHRGRLSSSCMQANSIKLLHSWSAGQALGEVSRANAQPGTVIIGHPCGASTLWYEWLI